MRNKLKDLDRNEIIIKWADEIVLAANHLGEVSRDSFMPDMYLSTQEPTQETLEFWRNDPARKIREYVISNLGDIKGQLDVLTKELIGYLEGVKNHLLSHRYIKEPVVTERFWRLSERGELMKELGGHQNYQKYRKREINVIKNQQLINIGLIMATTLAAVMPFVVAHFYPPTVTVNVSEPSQRPTHNDTVLLRHLVEEYERSKDSTKGQQKP